MVSSVLTYRINRVTTRTGSRCAVRWAGSDACPPLISSGEPMKTLLRSLLVMLMVAAGGLGTATAAHADVVCPSSGYACFYIDNGFLGDKQYSQIADPDVCYNSIGQHVELCDASDFSRISGVRNRTACLLRMYNGYSYTGQYIDLAANHEVSQIGTTYGSWWNDNIYSYKFFC